MQSFLRHLHHPSLSLQDPFDAAVVMTTVLRPSLLPALRSVLIQHGLDRVQVLVGIDQPGDGPADAADRLAAIESLSAALPSGFAVTLFWPGYSTAARNGGLYPAADGGSLRTILTHLANSRLVAYLDDDNAWTRDHLLTLRAALRAADADWSFSLRWFTDHADARPLAIDRWESVGPGAGVFRDSFGGFCDPNTLLLDRDRCRDALVAWTAPMPNDPSGMSADRMVFDRLRHLRAAATGRPTSLYRLNPADGRHPIRLRQMGIAAPVPVSPATLSPKT